MIRPEILTFFTNKVKQYLDEGYTLNPETEQKYEWNLVRAYDFVKDNKLVRISLLKEFWVKRHQDVYSVVIASAFYDRMPNHPIWSDRLTIESKKDFHTGW